MKIKKRSLILAVPLIIASSVVFVVLALIVYVGLAIIFDFPAKGLEYTLNQGSWKKYENPELGIGLNYPSSWPEPIQMTTNEFYPDHPEIRVTETSSRIYPSLQTAVILFFNAQDRITSMYGDESKDQSREKVQMNNITFIKISYDRGGRVSPQSLYSRELGLLVSTYPGHGLDSSDAEEKAADLIANKIMKSIYKF